YQHSCISHPLSLTQSTKKCIERYNTKLNFLFLYPISQPKCCIQLSHFTIHQSMYCLGGKEEESYLL
ncbi:hypothetical protein LINGRAHAP2_LOCUS27758, partial [Linum grandiflorum]